MNGFDDSDLLEKQAEEARFKPLSKAEAAKVRSQVTQVSLVSVLIWQAAAGAVTSVAVWGWTGDSVAGLSALYGALSVLLPAGVFARGLSRRLLAERLGMPGSAGDALAGVFVWELVKVVLTVAMLAAAPRIVAQLNWLALLAGFVVTMKVYWVAAWLGLGSRRAIKKLG